MNKGIYQVKGDIIGILNADDFFYPNALEIVKKYFEQHHKIDFLFGSVQKHTIQHGFYPNKIYRTFGFYSSHSVGFFIKTNSQKKVGYYNIKYKYSSDYDLFYRMIVKLKMSGVATDKNELLGYFGPNGISSRLKYIDYLNENTQIRLDNGQNKLIVWCIHYYCCLPTNIFFDWCRRKNVSPNGINSRHCIDLLNYSFNYVCACLRSIAIQ